jgi:hypothetical protein
MRASDKMRGHIRVGLRIFSGAMRADAIPTLQAMSISEDYLEETHSKRMLHSALTKAKPPRVGLSSQRPQIKPEPRLLQAFSAAALAARS